MQIKKAKVTKLAQFGLKGGPEPGEPLSTKTRMALEIKIIADAQSCAKEHRDSSIIDEDTYETIVEEAKSLISDSCPVVVSGAIGMLFSMICLIAVGHVGEQELAGTGFGIMFCNMTGYAVMIGIASGLETVASQLFGAGQHRLLGVALQRSIFVASVIAVPIVLFWLFSGFILPIFVEEDLARISGSFVRTMCLGLWPFLINECVQRYLNAQGIFLPSMYSSLAALVLFTPLCWYLVDTLGMGASGGAIALCAADALSLALLLAYIWWRSLHTKTWGGWSRDALYGTSEFLRITLPSCGMICLEWWCFEIVTLASGQLGTTAVAAQAVMFNTNTVAYKIGHGFAVAVGARVGNLLGAGRPAAARRAALLAWGACVVMVSVLSIGIYVWRNQWAGMPFVCACARICLHAYGVLVHKPGQTGPGTHHRCSQIGNNGS
jgi:MATE family multidrug resistance protein